MAATGEAILAVAAREIGYHEKLGKKTKYGEWYGLQGEPWCMEFVQWVYHQCDADLPLKTPSCGGLLGWFERNAPECITKDPIPGCIVIFNWHGSKYRTDHTGIFVKKTATAVTTIDGNTRNKSGGSDSNGGWVQERTRKFSDVKRIWYIIPPQLMQKEEDEDVKRYNTMREISDGAPWATETVAKLIETGIIKGSGIKDEKGRPADMNLSEDMLRLLVWNDRAGVYPGPVKA